MLGNRSDRTIAEAIVELVRLGYVDQLLLSHDICTKPQLKKYGGTGFAYISNYFVPTLRELGMSEENIHKIMVENPRRALTFVAPQPTVVTAASTASDAPTPKFRDYSRLVMTWVAPYSVAASTARLQESFGGVGMKDGLTHLALQFWEPTANGTELQRVQRGDETGDGAIAAP